MTGLVQDEKRIGCMSGFLQIFDRQQLLAGKRVHSAKRLLPSTDGGASPQIVSSVKSSELDKNVVVNNAKIQSKSPVSSQAKFELKDGAKKYSGKTLKEMPRLSLDSRATFDSKGSLRTKDVSLNNSVLSATTESVSVIVDGDDKHPRSPSVIARLMGLESLSSPSEKSSSHYVAQKPALQKSFSESRVKYIDNNNFQVKKPSQLQKQSEEDIVVKDKHIVRSVKSESSKANSWRSRTVFDSDDFYPMSVEEQKNDLGTLKQILEVLQLKGLLHSTRPLAGHRNFVYDRNVPSEESNIVVVKPCRSQVSKVDNRSSGRSSPVRGRNSTPYRIESNLKSCNSIVKRKPLSVEVRQRANDQFLNARSSPVKSPKVTPKRNGSSGHSSARTRSQSSQKRTESLPVYSPNRKIMKNFVTDDESSSISESSISTPTTNKPEAFRDGKTLLQRCDKLLESIAEMNNNTVESSPPGSGVVLPSPVSVLDLGFDKDESLSPSESIDIKATPTTEFEDEIWSHTMSTTRSTEHEEEFTSSDPDFIYISKILKSTHYLNVDPNAFLSIEKQLYDNMKDTSSLSKRHRKLVFDIIFEIVDRNRLLPPWKMPIGDLGTSVKNIWYEYKKMQEVNTGDSLLDLISGVLRKDLLEINGWGDNLIERSEMIHDIERMVFKDLVSDAIRDFDDFSGRFMFSKAQRKLVF